MCTKLPGDQVLLRPGAGTLPSGIIIPGNDIKRARQAGNIGERVAQTVKQKGLRGLSIQAQVKRLTAYRIAPGKRLLWAPVRGLREGLPPV